MQLPLTTPSGDAFSCGLGEDVSGGRVCLPPLERHTVKQLGVWWLCSECERECVFDSLPRFEEGLCVTLGGHRVSKILFLCVVVSLGKNHSRGEVMCSLWSVGLLHLGTFVIHGVSSVSAFLILQRDTCVIWRDPFLLLSRVCVSVLPCLFRGLVSF